MARMNVPSAAAREETPEERAKWKAFRTFIAKDVQPREGGTFEVRGYVKSIKGDPENPDQWLQKLNPRSGKMEARGRIIACVTDPRFPGLEWSKEAKVSFFDGAMRDGSTSPFRGFFFWIHRAVTGSNPPATLVSGNGDFDPDDYIGPDKPVMLKLQFAGRVEEGSQYYGRRGNMTIWLDGFEPVPEKVAGQWGDDDEDEWVDDATDPQGAMAQAMGHKGPKPEARELVAAGVADSEPWDE